MGRKKPGIRSRFLDEVDPAVVRNENGSTIKQKGDSESPRPSGTFIEYDYSKPLNTGYPGAVAGERGNTEGKTQRRTVYTRNGQGATSAPAANTGITYESAETEHLKPGVFVMHEKFGAGKILQREGQGSDIKLVVFFPESWSKKAGLEVCQTAYFKLIGLCLTLAAPFAAPDLSH